MGSIIEYAIATGETPNDVTEEVNKRLRHGWELHGELKVTAVVVGYGPGDEKRDRVMFRYEQAMVFRQA